MLSRETYMEDRQRWNELRADPSGYTGNRVDIITDSVEHSTPADWGEGYVYVSAFRVAPRIQGFEAVIYAAGAG